MSADEVMAVDPSGQLDDVLTLPSQLRDALFRVESARIEPFEASGLVVCGMGGSAVGGILARAALGDRRRRGMLVVRDYGLPPWTPFDNVVLCSSYSGETEETLAGFEAAEVMGIRRIVATTGGKLAEGARKAKVPVVGIPSGMQPRAAVGYMFTVAAEVAALSDVADPIRTEIDSAAAQLEESKDDLLARAAEIAERLDGTVPLIYGCDLTEPVAYRWKTQINENAKLAAFSGELPEINHNEIVGWQDATNTAPFSAVFLADSDQHPRERQRIDLSAGLLDDRAAAVIRVETVGETRTARMLWGVMLGDLVSIQLAARRGVDPEPIELLDRLKAELGQPGDA
jgi:glucose/mannose-6-phosphate isomerase